jgi:dienelactone hydrolase
VDAAPVELVTADGVTLRGVAEGGGATWAVLVHGAGGDLDGCAVLARELAKEGVAVLRLDLRGHGASEGEWSEDGAARDVEAALAHARARGAQELLVVGVAESADAVIAASVHDEPDAAVLVSPRASERARLDVRESAGPKLFLVGGRDDEAVAAVSRLDSLAIGPRLVVQLPTEEQGHALLEGACSAQAISHAVGFLCQHRTHTDT